LIVALGVVPGLMIGVFGAVFLNFLEKQKQEED
jgi:LPS O-antigen subunit length determinant protein (WzzB/FepE family)